MGLRTEWGTWRRIARGGVILFGLTGGCCTSECSQCGDGSVKDPGSPPSPLGTYVSMWYEEQAKKGEITDFTIYLDEWYMGGVVLGPFGLHHSGNIAHRMPDNPLPIVIEPHLDAALNEERRQIIVTALQHQGIGDAETRVVVAYPKPEGLYAEEGELIYYDMFQNRSGYGGFGFGQSGRRSGIWGSGYGLGGLGRGGAGGGGYGGGFGGYGGGFGGYGGFGAGRGYAAGYFGDGFIR